MNKIVALLLCIVAISSVNALTTRWHQLEATAYDHNKYMAEFGKVYASESERLFRKDVFHRNLAAIKEHNSKGLSWKHGVNHLTDRTQEELVRVRGHRRGMSVSRLFSDNVQAKHTITGKAIPDTVDYRTQNGVLTSVKDQGMCGSCWAFATAETVESAMFLALNKSVDLSEQQVASCTSNPMQCGGTGGCEGGTPEVAYESIIKNGGIASYSSYPYSSYFGTDAACKFADNKTVDPVVKLSGYKRVKSNDYDSLMDAVANVGPIAISVDASTWQSYESGIYDGCNQDSPAIDHAVQLVGYGEEAGKPYWIVRNSWAASWGENGFIRLFRDIKPRCGVDTDPSQGDGCKGGPSNVTVCGTCGILSDSSYPIIEKN